ncbi:response regulator [Azoarcus olearius]|uniref:Transcriptional regulatory protein n=1 Tax=Azoarcus sp. (strain BH72) TaxID=418699 RepID=A1K226_AZOSB|nr:response regulator [Azoarcus olearius]ANQ83354.1 transcriptional regulator [Azoarcus olearius]CAL92881.1 transcriptional regulatory protein [Azoarcus olearius]
MRILLVEDDALLGDGLQAGLRLAGFNADWVRSAEAAETALALEHFSAVVLDLGLPGRDGNSLLAALRQRHDDIPVLILTARDAVADKVRGLDLGADDYMVKPVDLDELAARLRAALRRAGGRASGVIRHGEVELDPAARRVRRAGAEVALTSREFDLLYVLLSRAGTVLTRRMLDEQLYAWDEGAESNTLEVHIHHLRRKLGADLIHTVRGVGYTVPA